MKTSNTEVGLAVYATQEEMDQINDKCGAVKFWAMKQTGPLEFMIEPAAEGEGVQFNESTNPNAIYKWRSVFKSSRPKTLVNRFWGAATVKELILLRSGVKFTPDTTHGVIRRNRGTDAARIHRKAEAMELDTGSLLSLRDFTRAVDTVNKFVTENEGHVVLEVRNGVLKFLAEG